MALIYLHNTLGNEKQVFKPINEGILKMYNCGPTVYNYVHIGNLRSNIFADTLRRVFEYNGYVVTQVVNITDVGHLRGDADEGEDKMTDALKKSGKSLTIESLKEHADFYTKAFLKDIAELNIETPTVMPRASEHIQQDIDLIEKLEQKGFAYSTSDGIYFDTSHDVDYGKLGGINKKDEGEARIKVNAEKRNPNDFALWKFNNELGWDSKWGKGFPGWHLECSAMAMEYLGETFDVHTGGIDHIPIHHNNEIAQSESATGKPFANYWLHNAFINIDGEKIAKSLGNDIYLQEVIDQGFSPLSYRYYILGAHYSTPMNFNWEALAGSQAALKKIESWLFINKEKPGIINQEYKNKFTTYINDDLDTPKALALIWELIHDKNVNEFDRTETILDFDKVLGLNLAPSIIDSSNIDEKLSIMLRQREQARKDKDWVKADFMRDEINKLGFEIKDTESGPKLSKL